MEILTWTIFDYFWLWLPTIFLLSMIWKNNVVRALSVIANIVVLGIVTFINPDGLDGLFRYVVPIMGVLIVLLQTFIFYWQGYMEKRSGIDS